jgi:hypothetical protein
MIDGPARTEVTTMTEQNESSPSDLGNEGLYATIRNLIRKRVRLEIKRSVGAGVAWMIFAAFLLFGGGFCLRYYGEAVVGMLVAIGLLLGGLYNLVWGLVWIADRSPMLILAEDALIDARTAPEQRIPWSIICRGNLARTTRNGAEQSARLTLYLSQPVGGSYEWSIDASNLDCDSQWLFKMIGERADLK